MEGLHFRRHTFHKVQTPIYLILKKIAPLQYPGNGDVHII